MIVAQEQERVGDLQLARVVIMTQYDKLQQRLIRMNNIFLILLLLLLLVILIIIYLCTNGVNV